MLVRIQPTKQTSLHSRDIGGIGGFTSNPQTMILKYIVYINDDDCIKSCDIEEEAQNLCRQNEEYWYMAVMFNETNI